MLQIQRMAHITLLNRHHRQNQAFRKTAAEPRGQHQFVHDITLILIAVTISLTDITERSVA